MYRLGIDLGGTNIAVGVVDEQYRIVGRSNVKTRSPRPAEEIIADMARAARLAVENAGLDFSQIDAVGVGSPGAINPETGEVIYSNNIAFSHVPMGQMLKDLLGIDVYVDNDANAAAYGEFLAGAGKGTKDFVMITLGTGVGGGVIIDGRIYSGSNHAGAELGHAVIAYDGEPCTCGRKGCFEAYASATALIRQTKEAMRKNPDSLMWTACEGDLERASGRTAFDAMRKGDAAAKAVVDGYIAYLAAGVVNLINIFQPEIFCIGGGISNEKGYLVDPLKALVEKENYARDVAAGVDIRIAALGNDAGIIGAAYLGK